MCLRLVAWVKKLRLALIRTSFCHSMLKIPNFEIFSVVDYEAFSESPYLLGEPYRDPGFCKNFNEKDDKVMDP